MARNYDRDRDRRSKRVLPGHRRPAEKGVCVFCTEDVTWIDYKGVGLLQRFLSDRGKIRSRRVTGNCARHQRDVEVAIKTGREVALLPYPQRTASERGPVRGPRGLRPKDGEPGGGVDEMPRAAANVEVEATSGIERDKVEA